MEGIENFVKRKKRKFKGVRAYEYKKLKKGKKIINNQVDR